MHFFRNSRMVLVILAVSAGILGCKSKIQNPESLDPIYSDLQSILQEHQKSVEDTEKEIASLRQEIADAEPNTKELHMSRKKLTEAKKRLIKVRQMTKYYEIRLERRRVEDMRAYSIAFEKDLPWPDPAEYSAYQANKRLRNSRPQWEARVPKLHSRLEKYQESRTPAGAPENGTH